MARALARKGARAEMLVICRHRWTLTHQCAAHAHWCVGVRWGGQRAEMHVKRVRFEAK